MDIKVRADIDNSESSTLYAPSQLNLEYPIQHFKNLSFNHEDLAKQIADNKWETLMVITCCDRLADEHWDNPKYMHKTNHIIVSEAQEMARKELTNRYFPDEKLKEIMIKHEIPDWEYNFKESDRNFKYKIKDELYNYQELMKIVEVVNDNLEYAQYKLDEDCYPIEDDDGEYTVETDTDVIEVQKERLLEKLLIPRIRTEYSRVYDMSEPFCYWDYRSSWHQGFFVLDHSEKRVHAGLGGSGSSGRRETNGRWSHTFALLAKEYNIETPTIFMRYDKNNIWREEFRLPTFATLGRDLSGNYSSTRDVLDSLFKGRTWDLHNENYTNKYVQGSNIYY